MPCFASLLSSPRLIMPLLLAGLLLTAGQLRAGAAAPLTLRYSPPDWPAPLYADLYRPDSAEPVPVVLVIHGGGWSGGARDDGYVRGICRHLAGRGLAALSVSYRLAPGARFPAQLDDLAEAVAWLRREGGGLGLDTRAIGLWGYSAGAHLASLMSMRAQALPVAGVVAGGTPADLRVWPDSPMVLDLLGQRRDQAPELWAAASPVSQAGTDTPPHFLYHGRLDTLVAHDQAESLRQALLAAGVPVTLRTHWLQGHVLAAIAPGRTLSEASTFLRARLAAPASAMPRPGHDGRLAP